MLCGYTYFPVKEISQILLQKSKKDVQKKNQYEKEYVVRVRSEFFGKGWREGGTHLHTYTYVVDHSPQAAM